jgi:hypothetical protein
MSFSPLLPVHITGGILGILSGAAAMIFRKGSARHALAGKVFVAAMLTMTTAAVYLAVMKQQTPNILAGTLTFYLVTTAWLTARRRDGETSKLDWVALLIPLVSGTWVWAIGLEKLFSNTPPKDGVPIGMNFFIGSVMLLAAAGDIRMLARGAVSGTKRLVRHLWRMCFGLFIATGSFFLGQQQVFPAFLRGSVLLIILGILPLILLFFWLFRVWFTNKGPHGVPQPIITLRTGEPGSALNKACMHWERLK